MSEIPEPHFIRSPQELAAALMHQREHAHMHQTDNTHRVNTLLESLDEEGLRALDMILGHADDEHTRGYFRGQIMAILKIKFGKCECGQSHDPADLLKDVEEDPMQRVRDEMVEATMGENLDPEYLAKLKEYGLEQDEAGSLRCANCFVPYVSLEDRMLKEPGVGGCSGCQQKSAWG